MHVLVTEASFEDADFPVRRRTARELGAVVDVEGRPAACRAASRHLGTAG
jgi:hypothetical protein